MQGLDPFDERDTVMNHDFLISQIDLREELEVIEEDRDSLGLEGFLERVDLHIEENTDCLLYTSPSPRDRQKSRMPSSA